MIGCRPQTLQAWLKETDDILEDGLLGLTQGVGSAIVVLELFELELQGIDIEDWSESDRHVFWLMRHLVALKSEEFFLTLVHHLIDLDMIPVRRSAWPRCLPFELK